MRVEQPIWVEDYKPEQLARRNELIHTSRKTAKEIMDADLETLTIEELDRRERLIRSEGCCVGTNLPNRP
jgi:hypothetical protein